MLSYENCHYSINNSNRNNQMRRLNYQSSEKGILKSWHLIAINHGENCDLFKEKKKFKMLAIY